MQPVHKILVELQKQVLQINENNFDDIAWRIFQYQAEHNELYAAYLKLVKARHGRIQTLEEIPFLPIRFFKSHAVKTGSWPAQHIFKSSGTTQAVRSQHYVWDMAFYLNNARLAFEKAYDSLTNFHVLCLLPAYDIAHSSLVAMARYFIARSHSTYSGIYKDDRAKLLHVLNELQESDRKVILLGVSHALLDMAATGPYRFKNLMVMETGGMKGRQKEITRAELHSQLKAGFGTELIFSEYGMTELLSQAYTRGGNNFTCAPTMRVLIKEVNDPFCLTTGTGIINVIDLANLHSCSFIETQDLGRMEGPDFQVLGRADNSDMRGCNLTAGQWYK